MFARRFIFRRYARPLWELFSCHSLLAGVDPYWARWQQRGEPLDERKTVVVPRTDVDINENGGQLRVVNGTTLRRLVAGLNQIGLKPSGIIAILQAIKSAGALQADLVTQ